MSIVLKNNAKTTLAANMSSLDTTIYVDNTSSFPAVSGGNHFYCTIESTTGTYEIVKVTQVNSGSFIVTRAQENTIAVPFNIGARVELRITVKSLEDHLQALISDAAVLVSNTLTARTLAERFGIIRDVKDYGAVWDGATHPLSGYYATLAAAQAVYPHAVALSDEIDWAAAQAAVNAGGWISFPYGTGLFNRQLNIGNGSAAAPSTLQNVVLLGKSRPAGNQITPQNYGTRIKFTGASGTDCIVRFLGPITGQFDGFHLDCNFLANGGYWGTHLFRSQVSNTYVGNHRAKAWLFDAWPTTVVGTTTGASINVLDHCYVGEPGTTTTTCIKIGGTPTEAGATDVQRFVIQNCGFTGGNSTSSIGYHFEYCDIVLVVNSFMNAGVAANACNAKLFKITGAQSNFFPQNIEFRHSPIICGASGYDIDAAWTSQNGRGVKFGPLLKADIESATIGSRLPVHALVWGETEDGERFGRNADDIGSGVAVPHTGNTTETVVATITLSAGALGRNGYVEVDAIFSMTNNANVKTIRARLGGIGGTILDSATPASVAGQRRSFRVRNRNATNLQVCGSTGSVSGTGSISAPSNAAIDTTAATTLVLTVQLANSGDTITLEEYAARIVRRVE